MSIQEMSIEPTESQTDDIELLQEKIADQMAILSTAESVPTGYTNGGEPFDASDVSFASNGWLLRLCQIQVWLNPDLEMSVNAIEVTALTETQNFFGAIGAINSAGCIVDEDGVVKMTQEGAAHLASRLDLAIKHQLLFSEALEEKTKQQATTNWSEAWGDEDDSDYSELDSEPIRAKTDIWYINDFTSRAKRNQLNLNPSYQRADVWPTANSQKLIESILLGIPLPSIILLKPGGVAQAKFEVVDGKQRLTSILRFMGSHPKAIELVKAKALEHPAANFVTHFNTDYKKFKRVWKTFVGESLTEKDEAKYYFPFRIATTTGPLKGISGKYYCEVRNHIINVGEGQVEIMDVFESTSDYRIPVIEYTNAKPRQIHKVFELYNIQGMHLNAEEIRNATYHEVELVLLVLLASGDNLAKAELAPYLPESKYIKLDRIAKCLFDYRFGTARYKRTKMISWLFALLFQPAVADGVLKVRSTAKHINSLFGSIRALKKEGGALKLSNHSVLIKLVDDADLVFETHSSAGCWSPIFMDNALGTKWQELQLIASLVTVFLLCAVADDVAEMLEVHQDIIYEFTENHQRPEKTQNNWQWGFIGEVAIGIIELLNINQADIETKLVDRYGVSCLPTLRAARDSYAALLKAKRAA